MKDITYPTWPQVTWKFVPNVYIATLTKKQIFDETIFSKKQIKFCQPLLNRDSCVNLEHATGVQKEIAEELFKIKRNSFYFLLKDITFSEKEVHITSCLQWSAKHMKFVEEVFKKKVRKIEIIQIF